MPIGASAGWTLALTLGLLVVAASCESASDDAAVEGCVSDGDCKADRVCVAGACQFPDGGTNATTNPP